MMPASSRLCGSAVSYTNCRTPLPVAPENLPVPIVVQAAAGKGDKKGG